MNMYQYSDEEAARFCLEIKNSWIDRGMMKWNGMYLSDHTNQMKNDSKRRGKVNQAKLLQSQSEIDTLLIAAYTKNKRVAIQIEELDPEGHYFDDIIGKVAGYSGLTIYITSDDDQSLATVNRESIRNIELLDPNKILYDDGDGYDIRYR